MTGALAAGDVILYREVDAGRVIDVKPVTVAEHRQRLVLWLPPGTSTKRPVLRDHTAGTPRIWRDNNWDLMDDVWRWSDAIILVRPRARRATWVLWHPDGRFRGWWVNLQSELRRTPLGFDFRDHQLDVIVEPDRRWRLKDEDELKAAVDQGRFTSAEATLIRAEAASAIDDVEANRPPFNEGWEAWRPAAGLPSPRLADGWDDLSMYSPDRERDGR